MKKIIIVLLGVFFIVCSGMIFETNNFGNYQIKQAAGTGEITVKNDAGLYLQMFGTITTYPVSEDVDFEAERLQVRFNDGSVANVKGTVKFKLPTNPEQQKELHRDYASYENVERDLILRNVAEALSNTATFMAAEDSYASGRAAFSDLAMKQFKDGIYKTSTKVIDVIDTDGTKFKKKDIRVVYDENNNPVIQKPSLLKHYGIEVLQFVVNDFEYDEVVRNLIAEKKKKEQEQVVSRSEAEKAKQEAITAEEKGKARIAEAKANAEVAKATEVTEAEKRAKVAKIQAEQDKEVARLAAEQAKFEAEKTKAQGEAEAYAAKKKVEAGLTPLEKATIEKETKIGIAEALSHVQFPSSMVISGGSNNNSVNPFDAVGLKSLYDLSEKMATKDR
ncbi:MAG: SPFH domain-containing protein [Clostridium sp.]|nr:SPFH domain-containing protein [Clostridium sp.]